jgi:hypothetical protein
MNRNNCHIDKKAPTKWLFAIVLLLSLFAFSGAAVQTQFNHDVPQTTLIAGAPIRSVKSISYGRAFLQTHHQQAFSFLKSSIINIGRLHNRQIKIRIEALKKCCPRVNVFTFLHLKTFPQSTDDPALS